MDHYQRKLRSKNKIKENLLGFNGNLNSQKYWIDLWQHKFYQLPRERKNWAHANLAIKVCYTSFVMYRFCFLFPRSLRSVYHAIKKSIVSSNKMCLPNISFCLTCKLHTPKGESIRVVMGAGIAEALKPWICSKANPSISLRYADEKLNNFLYLKYLRFKISLFALHPLHQIS